MDVFFAIVAALLTGAVIWLSGVFYENFAERSLEPIPLVLGLFASIFLAVGGTSIAEGLHIPAWGLLFLLPLSGVAGLVGTMLGGILLWSLLAKAYRGTAWLGRWARRRVDDIRLHREIERD